MSWREILNPNPSDFSDKSLPKDLLSDKSPSGDPFSHYCHQDMEIENKKPSKTDTMKENQPKPYLTQFSLSLRSSISLVEAWGHEVFRVPAATKTVGPGF